MANENNTTEGNKPQESNLTENDVVDLFNELMTEKEQEISDKIMETVQADIKNIVNDILDKKEKPAEGEGEEGNTTEETKSIIQETLQKELGRFFKSIDKNREANPSHVTEELNTVQNEGNEPAVKEFTPSEIAEAVYKRNNTPARMIQNMLR